jgi:RNA polymerase sigma-70 factor (ECF subfamily)
VVRHALLVAEPGAPARIAGYAGRGPLRAWVRATAIRAALKMNRKERPEGPAEESFLLGDAAVVDPVLAGLRRRYAPEFRGAFEAALAALDSQERVLLRQHFVDGVGTEDLAALHGVHRVTMFRWLAKLRTKLLVRTRRELRARIGVDEAELDSIMRMVRSHVELTLERVLAVTPPA